MPSASIPSFSAVCGMLKTDALRLRRDRFLIGISAYILAITVLMRWILPCCLSRHSELFCPSSRRRSTILAMVCSPWGQNIEPTHKLPRIGRSQCKDWTRSGLTNSLATRQVTLTYDGGPPGPGSTRRSSRPLAISRSPWARRLDQPRRVSRSPKSLRCPPE